MSIQGTYSTFEYLQFILPICSGIILAIVGWIFSYKTLFLNFKNEIRKEHHQKLKDAYFNINNLFSQFFEFVYDFINRSIDMYQKGNDFDEYNLSKFSSDKMLKLNFIFNIINIEFPKIYFDREKYINNSNGIEIFYTKMRNLAKMDDKEKYISCITDISKIIGQLSHDTNNLLSNMSNEIDNRFKTLKIKM